jgi:hypothetical protein
VTGINKILIRIWNKSWKYPVFTGNKKILTEAWRNPEQDPVLS